MSDQSSNKSRSDLFKVGAPSAVVAGRLAQALKALSETSSLADTGSTTVPEVAAGQFWRAVGTGKSTTAVLVLGVSGGGSVRVLPATFDPDLSTDRSRVLQADDAGLGAPVVLWVDFATKASVAVLDTWLGQLHADAGVPTNEMVSGLAKSGKTSRPIHTPTDVRAELEADLADEMEALANAKPWQPVTAGDLHEMLAELKATELAEVLHLSKPDALSVKRGARPLTDTEAALLSQVVGKPAEELATAGPPLPDAVVDLFNTPRVRAGVRDLARRSGVDESMMRVQAAYDVASGIAARTTNRTGEAEAADVEMWSQRVRQYFEVKLGRTNLGQ